LFFIPLFSVTHADASRKVLGLRESASHGIEGVRINRKSRHSKRSRKIADYCGIEYGRAGAE